MFGANMQILTYAAGRGFHTTDLQFTPLRLGKGYAGIFTQEQCMVNTPDLQGRKTDFLRSPH
jgi:hypothetical protein